MPLSPDSWSGFVAFPENGAAIQAVRRVVRAIQKKKRLPFDVLVVHGPTGSGKSHLASAAASEIVDHHVLAAFDFGRRGSDEDLTQYELLIIEDVQQLKPQFCERFAWLLDMRAAYRRYTIVTSTTAPADLDAFSHRVTSRLIGGLVVNLGLLSLASRVKLVRRFAEDRNRKIPDANAVELAQETPGGIRLLMGAVEQWIATAQIEVDKKGKARKRDDSPKPATSAVDDWIAANTPKAEPPSIAKPHIPEFVNSGEHPLAIVVEKVAKAFELSVAEILGTSQLPSISTARQVVILIGRQELDLKFNVIARYLNRAGSSIHGAEYSIRWKMVRDPQLTIRINQVIDECRELVRKLVAHSSRE